MRSAIVLLVSQMLLVFSSNCEAATLTHLGVLSGYSWTVATAVSADGSAVVGYCYRGGDYEAFLWTEETGMTGLGHLQDDYSKAWGVSGDGSVVVGASDGHAFRWTEEDGMVQLADLTGGLNNGKAAGISSDGSTTVGYGYSGNIHEAVCWGSDDTPIALGSGRWGEGSAASADGSVVVGAATDETPRTRSFRWTEEDGFSYLDDAGEGIGWNVANDVSSDGTVIVGAMVTNASPYSREAYRWTEDGWLGLGDFEGSDCDSWAKGVSGDGSVIVGYGTTSEGKQAFYWTEDGGMQLLRDVAAAQGVDVVGWNPTTATAISDDGLTIVDSRGWLLQLDPAPVPEPHALAIWGSLGILGGGLGAFRRRKK